MDAKLGSFALGIIDDVGEGEGILTVQTAEPGKHGLGPFFSSGIQRLQTNRIKVAPSGTPAPENAL